MQYENKVRSLSNTSLQRTYQSLSLLLLILICGLTMSVSVPAQLSFPGTNTGPIPDAPGPGPGNYSSPRDVMFNATGITGVASIVLVDFNANHTFVGDLRVMLISPNGTEHKLFERTGATTTGVENLKIF